MPRAVRSIRECVILVAVAILSVSAVGAQESAPPASPELRPSFELFGGWIRSSPDLAGATTLTNSYNTYYPTYHVVTVSSTTYDTGPMSGFDTGTRLFVSRHFGLLARYDFLQGTLSAQPGEVRTVTPSGVGVRSTPATTGWTRLHTISIGPTARLRLGRSTTWSVTAGYASIHLYSRFEAFGGVRTQLSATTPGLSVGTGLTVHLRGPFALVADVHHVTGKRKAPFVASDVELPDESKALNLSHTRVMLGVHITPWRKRDVDIVDGWKAR